MNDLMALGEKTHTTTQNACMFLNKLMGRENTHLAERDVVFSCHFVEHHVFSLFFFSSFRNIILPTLETLDSPGGLAKH